MVTFKQFQEDPIKKGEYVPNRVYFQVDGEYMAMEQPKYLKLGLSPDLPNGKVWIISKKRD